MQRYIFGMMLALVGASAWATDVGVSVQFAEPGLYGRINIGDFPRPEVIYERPVIIRRERTRVIPEPIYMHVPPGHAKHWSKHCHKYNACGRPVYFIQDRWYRDVYVPSHQHGRGHWDERGHDYHDYRGHDDNQHDHGREHGHDHGRGHGHGHGRGHGRD